MGEGVERLPVRLRATSFGEFTMSLSVSRRVQRVKPSPTVALTGRVARLLAAGRDIVNLGVGEPDFDTPMHIADAGVEAIRKGHTRYTPVDGTAELKDAVIAKFRRENDLQYQRELASSLPVPQPFVPYTTRGD